MLTMTESPPRRVELSEYTKRSPAMEAKFLNDRQAFVAMLERNLARGQRMRNANRAANRHLTDSEHIELAKWFEFKLKQDPSQPPQVQADPPAQPIPAENPPAKPIGKASKGKRDSAGT